MKRRIRNAFINGHTKARSGDLSTRETQVLKIIADGLATKAIASIWA